MNAKASPQNTVDFCLLNVKLSWIENYTISFKKEKRKKAHTSLLPEKKSTIQTTTKYTKTNQKTKPCKNKAIVQSLRPLDGANWKNTTQQSTVPPELSAETQRLLTAVNTTGQWCPILSLALRTAQLLWLHGAIAVHAAKSPIALMSCSLDLCMQVYTSMLCILWFWKWFQGEI